MRRKRARMERGRRFRRIEKERTKRGRTEKGKKESGMIEEERGTGGNEGGREIQTKVNKRKIERDVLS